jgi:hypothetical protein
MSEVRSLDADCVGPAEWTSLHAAAAILPATVPPSLWNAFADRLNGSATFFGCKTCRDHLKHYLKTRPLPGPVGATREALFRYTVDLHNTVNIKLAKPEVDWKVALNHYDAISAVEGSCNAPGVSDCAAKASNRATEACAFATGCAVKRENLPKSMSFKQAVRICQSGGLLASTVILSIVSGLLLLLLVAIFVRNWPSVRLVNGFVDKMSTGLFGQSGLTRRVFFDLRHNRRRTIPNNTMIRAAAAAAATAKQ